MPIMISFELFIYAKGSLGLVRVQPLIVVDVKGDGSKLRKDTQDNRDSIDSDQTPSFTRLDDDVNEEDVDEVKMDNPNITMEEYIRLEEEKARRRAIVFNDTLTSEATLSCEPTVSSLNDEIDFRISYDESDDEDCTSTLDFEKEFPAIVYNDAQTSKLDFLTEPTLSPQHIDEFDLKDETSLSECDEEEQNVLNFNDLFPFNVIYPDELKTDTDNDNDKVDIEHSSGDLSVKPLPDVINTDVGAYAHGSNKLLETRPCEGNIDEYWWRIYKSRNLEVLES
ncbi:hypothetical protein Tco_0052240 [Tanacetum coccineum]